ncbi:hypothetical protein [Streptomyces cyaneofuscatus]|uniref:hypothetical protein n=1 Tax=Streptomyces cyaneofuscatus TaxID=66883 RepID=UPI00364DF680
MTVVVAKHRDAVPRVAAQRAVAIGVICSEEDGKEGRAALDRALAEAEGRGCRVAHAPRTLGGQQGRGKESLLKEFHEVRPQRLLVQDRHQRPPGQPAGVRPPDGEGQDQRPVAAGGPPRPVEHPQQP